MRTTSRTLATSVVFTSMMAFAARAGAEAPPPPGSASAPVAAPLPSATTGPLYALPPPQPPREVWYGWQTLIAAGASMTVGLVPIFFGEGVALYTYPVGIGGSVFSGPIVHWAHGRVGRGFAVLGMNLGFTGLGLGLSIPIACAVEKCDGFYFTYGMLSSYVGAAIGVALDVALLSTYTPPPPSAFTKPPSVLASMVPILDVGRGRAVFGVGSAF